MGALRVLMLTETYPPGRGGMAESCDRIVHGLRRAGVEVDVAHLSRHGERPERRRQQGGELLLHPAGPDGAHALATLYPRLARRGGYSHLLAFGGALPLLGGPVYAAWLRVPLLVLLRGNEFDVGVFSPGRAEVLLRALSAATRVLSVSRDKAERAAALVPGLRATVIPNGIDLSRFAPLPSQLAAARALRERARGPEGRRVVGLFGQLKRKKGALELVEAMLQSGEARRFHLLLVGEAEEELRGRLAVSGAELSHQLEPAVDRYELLSRYPACDLVALPSHYDGMPNVLLEAAALSLPLLASSAGGMGDVLSPGEHGLLFDPGDEDGLREAVRRAAELPEEELRRMGAAWRALVQRELTDQIETERYLQVLRETEGGR